VSLFFEVVTLLTIILTSFYSGRLILILFSSFRFLSLESTSDGNFFLLASLFILGVGAIFSGFILQKRVLTLNVFIKIPPCIKSVPLLIVFSGLVFSLFLFLKKKKEDFGLVN